MKALVTGVSGFVGTILCEKLLDIGYEVTGISRTPAKSPEVKFVSCDIKNVEKVAEIIKDERPDEIFHLASTTFVPHSYLNSLETYTTIVNGTLALLEAVKELRNPCKVLFVGSAGSYGEGRERPFKETDSLQPDNPYSSAKACAELICDQYFKTFNMDIIRSRPFNHTGPGQTSDFVCSNFAKQIAAVEKGKQAKLLVGNIDVLRDFLDVRDVIEAYLLLMKHGKAGEVYNVSSGKAVEIKQILDMMISYSTISNPIIEVQSKKLRDKEITIRIGDNTKIKTETGWTPQYHLAETMKDLLEKWRCFNE